MDIILCPDGDLTPEQIIRNYWPAIKAIWDTERRPEMPDVRRSTTTDLVIRAQRLQERIEEIQGIPDTQYDITLYKMWLKDTLNELARREKLSYNGIQRVNQNIIQAIKELMPIVDVLGWYTQVFTHKRQWTFRCTLHGTDTEPSGVIYPVEKRWWCYGCNAGGDVFDAVQAFERITLIEAIKKLARHTGFNLTTPPAAKLKGGIRLGVKDV